MSSKMSSIRLKKKGWKGRLDWIIPTRNTLFKWQKLEMLGFNDSFKNRTLVHAIGQGPLPSKDQHNGRSTLNMFYFKWLKMLHYPDRNELSKGIWWIIDISTVIYFQPSKMQIVLVGQSYWTNLWSLKNLKDHKSPLKVSKV